MSLIQQSTIRSFCMATSLEELLATYQSFQDQAVLDEAMLDASATQAMQEIASGVPSSAERHLALLDVIYRQVAYCPLSDLSPAMDHPFRLQIDAARASQIDWMLEIIELSPYRDQLIASMIGEMIVCENYRWITYLERLLPIANLTKYPISPIKLQHSDPEYHEMLFEWTTSSDVKLIFVNTNPDQHPSQCVPMVASKIAPLLPNNPGAIAHGWVLIGKSRQGDPLGEIYLASIYRVAHDSHEPIILVPQDPDTCYFRVSQSDEIMKTDSRGELFPIQYGSNCALTGQIHLPAAIQMAMG